MFNYEQRVKFDYFRDGALWYSTLKGFQFSVPINTLSSKDICLSNDKAERFKYWIKRELNKKFIDKKKK